MSVIRKFIKPKAPQIPPCSAVIVAAGSSERMGFDKMTAEIGGMPVIARTIKAFENCPCIDEIVVVTKMDNVPQIADICKQNGFSKVAKVVSGGKTRTESALAGVCEVKPGAKLVAIHDGARPLVTLATITCAVYAASEMLAAAPAVKATDTIKIINDKGMVTETLDRAHAVCVQTPQVFAADLIKGALTKAVESGLEITDDCSAVEAIGMNVFTIDGDEENIKLTRPSDILTAERILKDRGELY